jgi:hypothetical protein
MEAQQSLAVSQLQNPLHAAQNGDWHQANLAEWGSGGAPIPHLPAAYRHLLPESVIDNLGRPPRMEHGGLFGPHNRMIGYRYFEEGGIVDCEFCDGDGTIEVTGKCGSTMETSCPKCDGEGELSKTDDVPSSVNAIVLTDLAGEIHTINGQSLQRYDEQHPHLRAAAEPWVPA